LVAVRFGLLISAKQLVRKTGFLYRACDWLGDRLQNDLYVFRGKNLNFKKLKTYTVT